MEENYGFLNNKHKNVTFDDLIELLKTYIKKEESIALVTKAYNIAYEAHKGQFRKSGDPYIQHPLEVAYLLTSIHSSPQTVCAGLLHDVLEDTSVTKEELIDDFGVDIYNIVEGVTKIGQLKYMTKEKALARTHQKILLAMAKDIRVVLVKLLDRVHNMRTLEFQPREKQIRISQETLDLYAPLAHRIGMYRIKAELEDTAFKYINPEKYKEIEDAILTSQSKGSLRFIFSLANLVSRDRISMETAKSQLDEKSYEHLQNTVARLKNNKLTIPGLG